MGIWKKLFGEGRAGIDYYREGVELLRVSKYHEALTSFRLALRESPQDPAVLQQIAIAYTRIGMTDEAVKTYRTVLAGNPAASGAHYGLAFLLLRQGHASEAEQHLRSFLSAPPDGADAERHVKHAQETLAGLERGAVPEADG
jgi:Flp pilus assembly protein TadD